MKNFLISLLITGSLASCAPSVQAGAPLIVDPVFAPGQIWQVTWAEGDVSELTVPDRDLDDNTSANYRKEIIDSTKANKIVTGFRYDPVNVNFGAITALLITGPTVLSTPISSTQIKVKVCVVRNPGTVTIGQPISGYFSSRLDAAEDYAETGKGNFSICSLKRLK